MLGKATEHIIKNDALVSAIIGTAIYPIAAIGKGLPSIYYIIKAIPEYNKNGQQMTQWRLTILTMCKNYSTSWDLALKIKQAFEKKARATVEGIKFTKIECKAITDDYEFNLNSFGQTIEFDIRAQSIIAT